MLGACVPVATPPKTPARAHEVAVEKVPALVEWTPLPALPLVAGSPGDPAPRACGGVECSQAKAAAAERRGALDVAAAFHGEVFVQAPTAEHLGRWIDALVASGDEVGIREALEIAKKHRRLASALAGHRRALVGRVPAAAPRADALRAAYAADAAGRGDEATRLFAAALTPGAAPADLDHAAELLHARGRQTEASRLWSAARVGLRGRGPLHVRPLSSWQIVDVRWRGQALATLHTAEPLDPGTEPEEGFSLLRIYGQDGTVRALRFPAPVYGYAFAFSDDGALLVRGEGDTIVVQDVATGAEVRRLGGTRVRLGKIAAHGSGDALVVAAEFESGVVLLNMRGEQVGAFEHGLWPGVYQMGLSATHVAIGGQEGGVELHARADGSSMILVPDGGQQLIELRFVADERRLMAVHANGVVSTWDGRSGALLRRVPGRCGEAELAARLGRDLRTAPPTAEERRACAEAWHASIAADGSFVATMRDEVRVRDADGALRGRLDRQYANRGDFALGDAGRLVLADMDSVLAMWRPGEALVRVAATHEGFSRDAWELSSSGRFLWTAWDRPHVWDLGQRRALEPRRSPDEQLLAVSDDGRFAAVAVAGVVEFRDPVARTASVRVQVSTDHLWNVVFAGAYALVRGIAGEPVHVVDLSRGTWSSVALPANERPGEISPDGRWITTYTEQGSPVRIRSAATGEAVHLLDGQVLATGFSPDGVWVAWLVAIDDERHEARAMRLDAGPPQIHRLPIARGLPRSVAVAGGEVLFFAGDRLTRWDPVSGRQMSVRIDSGGHIQVPEGGRTLILGDMDTFEIRTNDRAMRLLATLYGLQTGAWLVISASGAIDGSADAAASLIAFVERDGERAREVFSGRLAWDAAYVPGVLARALAGEDVRPPSR